MSDTEKSPMRATFEEWFVNPFERADEAFWEDWQAAWKAALANAAIERHAAAQLAAAPVAAQEPVYCGCGDQIMPDDGARCGTCVAVKYRQAAPVAAPHMDKAREIIAAFDACTTESQMATKGERAVRLLRELVAAPAQSKSPMLDEFLQHAKDAGITSLPITFNDEAPAQGEPDDDDPLPECTDPNCKSCR